MDRITDKVIPMHYLIIRRGYNIHNLYDYILKNGFYPTWFMYNLKYNILKDRGNTHTQESDVWRKNAITTESIYIFNMAFFLR